MISRLPVPYPYFPGAKLVCRMLHPQVSTLVCAHQIQVADYPPFAGGFQDVLGGHPQCELQ